MMTCTSLRSGSVRANSSRQGAWLRDTAHGWTTGDHIHLLVRDEPGLAVAARAQVIAYDDLGAEAIRRLIVKDFPVIVAIDAKGNNIYENEIKKYRNYLKDKQEEVYESNGN